MPITSLLKPLVVTFAQVWTLAPRAPYLLMTMCMRALPSTKTYFSWWFRTFGWVCNYHGSLCHTWSHFLAKKPLTADEQQELLSFYRCGFVNKDLKPKKKTSVINPVSQGVLVCFPVLQRAFLSNLRQDRMVQLLMDDLDLPPDRANLFDARSWKI